MSSGDWQPSVFLSGDVAEKVAEIKKQPGPDLHVYGSANLVQTLSKHDLIDAFWLKIYPVTLGGGKRLFAEGTGPHWPRRGTGGWSGIRTRRRVASPSFSPEGSWLRA